MSLSEQVARDRAVAAAVADDRDAPAAWPVRREERLGNVDKPARRVHEMDPGCAACSFDRVATARERAGVRSRGATSLCGPADRQQDDRLSGSARRLDERPAVEEVLAVHPD